MCSNLPRLGKWVLHALQHLSQSERRSAMVRQYLVRIRRARLSVTQVALSRVVKLWYKCTNLQVLSRIVLNSFCLVFAFRYLIWLTTIRVSDCDSFKFYIFRKIGDYILKSERWKLKLIKLFFLILNRKGRSLFASFKYFIIFFKYKNCL